jgi:hypothetical protein
MILLHPTDNSFMAPTSVLMKFTFIP